MLWWMQRLHVCFRGEGRTCSMARARKPREEMGKLHNSFAFVCVVYVLIRGSINSQLNVKEALELCRYEWMQSALEEFLRVMTEDGSSKEETLSPSGISKRGERQIDSRYCFVVN